MLSPCLNCGPVVCVLGDRKKDCLAPYPNLRRIGNSIGGFEASSENPNNWPEFERNFYLKQIERKIVMPRGRPKKNEQSTQATSLLAALNFVKIASNDDKNENKFIKFQNNMVIATNGQLSAGHPVQEELTLCPQIDKLIKSVGSCGKSLLITETPNGQLSVKGDKLKSLIQCLPASDLYFPEPDLPLVQITDIFKEAFKVCGVLASEAGEKVYEASLLLEANTCTGTDSVTMLQFWHGYDLPPNMVLPKVFTQAVAREAKPLTGFGFSWGDNGKPKSVTFWFEGGAWIKTQCYLDDWPNVSNVLDVTVKPVDPPKEFANAIEIINDLTDENLVVLSKDKISTSLVEGVGSEYETKGITANKSFQGSLLKRILPFITKIDLDSHYDKMLFFGGEPNNPIRGALACMRT